MDEAFPAYMVPVMATTLLGPAGTFRLKVG